MPRRSRQQPPLQYCVHGCGAIVGRFWKPRACRGCVRTLRQQPGWTRAERAKRIV